MPDTLREQLQAVLGDTYRIERELPPGGMSRLFVATERSLERDHAQLFEVRNRVPRERFVLEIGERGAAPEPKRLAEDAASLVRSVFREQLSSPLQEILEAVAVQCSRIEAEQISAGAGFDRLLAE